MGSKTLYNRNSSICARVVEVFKLGKGLDMVVVAEATAEHPRNDSASIVELRDGSLFIVWMEYEKSALLGHDEAPHPIAAMISRDGGKTWGEHRVLVERGSDEFVSNPTILRLKNGDIILSFGRCHEWVPRERAYSRFVWRSKDEGKTFPSQTTMYSRRFHETSPGNTMIQLSFGRLIQPIGASVTLGAGGYAGHVMAGCYISNDDGYSWMEPTSWVDLPMRGIMEPHVVELEDGRLLMYTRTQLGAIFQSESKDGGLNWSKPQTTGVRAPESCPCLTKIPKTGDLLLVWNHSMYDPGFDHYGKRTPLTVAISRDKGRNWENFKNIESDPNWEFTNPSCNFTSQDKAIITYVASPMAIPHPPGRLGRSRMTLKAAIADIEWFYKNDP